MKINHPWFNIISKYLPYLFSGKIIDFSNADVAVDQYHRFEVDNWTLHSNTESESISIYFF